jgi:hypothetical protein
MPSFTVTAAGQRVNLGISGGAQASFTVTNTSTQTLRARMMTRPGDSASPEWFSIVGEPVREVAPNEDEQVLVQLSVPPTAPAGAYSFRLDAVSAVDPDEDFTEGPSVEFDVEGQPPPKKKFPWVPWWILAIVGGVVLLIVIGVVVWLLVRDGSRVSSGKGTIPAGSLFDVDTGTVPPAGGAGADLNWVVFGQLRAMVPAPQTNATLVNIGVVDFDKIDEERLSKLTYGTAGIPAHLLQGLPNDLVNGDVFAVRSADGNFAKIKVVSPDNQLRIQWVTYRPGN